MDLDLLSTRDWIERRKISPLAKLFLHAEFAADNGVDTERQSYLANLEQYENLLAEGKIQW